MLTDVRTAAKKLSCSQSHIRRMIKRGVWPVYKLGPGAIRVDPEEIRALTRVRCTSRMLPVKSSGGDAEK
jgi:excisionase family DNA binding protein